MGFDTEPSSSQAHWIIFYPLFIRGSVSIKNGRKVSTEHCPKNPMISDMSEALKSLSISHIIEEKTHPSDFFHPGRIRIRLFDENKKPLHDDYPNRMAIFRQIGKMLKEKEEKPTVIVQKKRKKKK
eukprot:TRINITY_DN33784_c0_g1_i1.p1 TRINITY_DN33784_c0_g1~~TRINITY_DN33784_c0_g1_i1.p1  ORF type:complete len:126 (+),score=23.02 TRINITY_DN33784_c0_g1_i1:49-426(+)